MSELLQNLIHQLLAAETSENNNLIDILASLKPKASLNSIIRGLVTKNNKLLKLLNNCLAEIANDPKESFKNFVNDFILWLENDGFYIFEKYYLFFPLDYDYNMFGKPLIHCENYIFFMEDAISLLRNPFIIDKLTSYCERFQSLLDNYHKHSEDLKLNDISFNNIQKFASQKHEKVSCFFKTDQIVDRTKNEPLYLDSSRIELLLVNLNNCDSYNALALLGVPNNEQRYLLYPPFRVNELSISFTGSLVLSALKFSKSIKTSEKLTISGNHEILQQWYEKLSVIFPNASSPVGQEFLIKSTDSFQLSGLGIKTFAYSPESPENVTSMEKPSFQDLISSPTLTSSPLNQLSLREFNQPQRISSRKNSIDTASIESAGVRPDPAFSQESMSSNSSQYKRSMEIIHKTLLTHSRENPDYIKNISKNVHMESTERPVSSRAEIVESPKETPEPVTLEKPANLFYSSVPDLSASKNDHSKKGMYTLSTGSAIDINNFGLSHNPSFSVHNGLSTLTQKPAKKKSFFKLFKKKKEPVNTDLTDFTPPQKLATFKENEEKDSQETLEQVKKEEPEKTTLPSPFALPSSTSTYFFKPMAKSPESESTALYIPQSLKDVINSDDSIDFYISPSSPKAMKVSRWKEKYGKWEMLTVNENVFMKIVANYELNKAWLIFFSEEYDEHYDEIIDKPMLLLNISEESQIRQSSALDLQITSPDAISNQKLLVMVRCSSGSLCTAILSNFNNISGVMQTNKSKKDSPRMNDSNVTISSSLMDAKASASSTLTTINTSEDVEATVKQNTQHTEPILGKEISFASLSSEDITNANIISNPDNTKLMLLNQMTVRLQEQLESYDSINVPSSWKILLKYSLTIFMISDYFTGKGYYNLILESNDANNDEDTEYYNWLIAEDDKLNRIERIGKAGLLVKATTDKIFMIECKGKKEFKTLYELF